MIGHNRFNARILLGLAFLLAFSCSQMKENDIISLLQEQERRVEYETSNINNLDTFKGFRGLQIGMHLDSLFINENIFNVSEDPEMNLIAVSSVLDHNDVEVYLGVNKINVVSLYFFDKKLRRISLTFRNNEENLDENRFLAQLSNTFGIRNNDVDCDLDRQLSSYHDFHIPIEIINSASWVANDIVLNYCYTKDLEAYNYYGGRLRYQLSYEAHIEYLDKLYVDKILNIRRASKENRINAINRVFERREKERQEERRKQSEERMRQDLREF